MPISRDWNFERNKNKNQWQYKSKPVDRRPVLKLPVKFNRAIVKTYQNQLVGQKCQYRK
jgi:hypothetical protein